MDYQLSQSNIYIISPTIIYFISIFLVLLMVLWLTKRIFKDFIQKSKYFDHIIYLVRLPKERPGDETKEPTTQEIREDISVGETIFASIGGLRAQRGLRAWLFGRNDHFSFEVVASKKKIAFYVVAPREMGRYIEQQVHAHYPSAVIEEVDDYNIFRPDSAVLAGYQKTKRNLIFPIKTYNKMETDPMNSIINVMSKLEDGEGLAIQYLVRSAKPAWHSEA